MGQLGLTSCVAGPTGLATLAYSLSGPQGLQAMVCKACESLESKYMLSVVAIFRLTFAELACALRAPMQRFSLAASFAALNGQYLT